MNINQLIEIVKNKISKNIPCDKIEIEDNYDRFMEIYG